MRRRLRLAWRAAFGGALSSVAVAGALWLDTDVDRARFAHPRDALTVTDRHGTALRHHRPDGHDRRWVSIDEVSPHLVDAVVATEDQRFFEHAGVDPRATARAAVSFVWPGRRVSGASTITQQVVKLVYGRPHGLWDKPREIVRALRLEQRFDKRWILEQYLNRLPYGDQVVGVARASELYFGKPVAELTVGEAALLAGIPQAPTALDPRRHPSAAQRRRRVVLARMRATGRIDEATHRAALAEPVSIRARSMRPWRAPRLADAALAAWRRGALPRRGRALVTSVDLPLQREVERELRAAVEAYATRGVTNAAGLVVANETGEVLAYVGAARRGSDVPGGWLDLARARRQPGSTLKPFVYELLFEGGGTAATVLDDLSRPRVGGDGAIFTARDYDGRERGPVRARIALSASLNLAALDAASRVGAAPIVARLRALGMDHLDDPSRYGAAIVLGGADVSPWELAGAYVTLARGGSRVPLSLAPVRAVEPVRVMEPGPAALTRDVLRDPAARRAAFGDDRAALFGAAPFGLKTGTSSGWRDAWTAVFTDAVTVVVWLGDPAGRPLGAVSGFDGASRPAVRVLAAAHRRLPALGRLRDGPVDERPTLVSARVCAHTGRLAGPRCVHAVEERFVPGTLPTRRCDAHRDDGAVALPARYAAWLARERPAGFALAPAPARRRDPRVAYPEDGARLLLDPRRGAAIPLRATVAGGPASVRWEIDGRPLDEGVWRPAPGPHRVVAVLGDRRSRPAHVRVRLAGR
ncbi:MAG TPA: transglycosylase domain-containing protein [Sandaracinaceae bacterium LLY-WYZ-13_1]|nr:transglycosylase domain-containing protein [Sandaracinaceae bacterium LLY-WYZ-13_1]